MDKLAKELKALFTQANKKLLSDDISLFKSKAS